jgi:hypothetical protein
MNQPCAHANQPQKPIATAQPGTSRRALTKFSLHFFFPRALRSTGSKIIHGVIENKTRAGCQARVVN